MGSLPTNDTGQETAQLSRDSHQSPHGGPYKKQSNIKFILMMCRRGGTAGDSIRRKHDTLHHSLHTGQPVVNSNVARQSRNIPGCTSAGLAIYKYNTILSDFCPLWIVDHKRLNAFQKIGYLLSALLFVCKIMFTMMCIRGQRGLSPGLHLSAGRLSWCAIRLH